MLEQDLMERLLPIRRLRSQPRVVKRKMSNYHLKRRTPFLAAAVPHRTSSRPHHKTSTHKPVTQRHWL